MEAAAEQTDARGGSGSDDRELALRLGAMMLCTLSAEGGSVVRAIDESGLGFTQMKALVTLAAHDEDQAATVNRLADELGISLASASRAVDGLVRRGLVTRQEDPADRRVRRLAVTAAGEEVADELLAARLAGVERFVESLAADERRKLDAALTLLLRRDDVAENYRSYRRRARR